MNSIKSILLDIDNQTDVNKLVQIIELASCKLDLKTISNYAKDNNISYNGAKKCRNNISINGVKFIVDGLGKNNLPF